MCPYDYDDWLEDLRERYEGDPDEEKRRRDYEEAQEAELDRMMDEGEA